MKFNKFIAQIPDLKMVRKHSERRDGLIGLRFDSLVHLPYKVLKTELPDAMNSGDLERAILLVLRSKSPRLPLWRVKYLSNYKKLKFVFWIQDQYKILNELEAKYLQSAPDAKLVQAGIHELDILGDKNLIDNLAGGDVLKWEQVQQLPYEVVFDKQLKTVIEGRIASKLNKIK